LVPILFAHIKVGQDLLHAADTVGHANEEWRIRNQRCAARDVGISRRQERYNESRLLRRAPVVYRCLQPSHGACKR
jgi:hypothetical protein